jgi:glucose-1-phosphate cytidylyltransferase
MKVVIFCGGVGLRMADAAPRIPKPMVTIGNRPILWHIMKYYAHHGHKDFILCLGHKADVIKDFFLNYSEALANDFVLTDGGRHVELLSSDIGEWRITFVDTGLHSNIGERLAAVRRHVDDQDYFLATYGDAVTDAPLGDVIARHIERDKTATFLCVRPTSYSFHTVTLANGVVTGIQDVAEADIWINGGFFVFRRDIFDFIHDGEDLVAEPFVRLIEDELLLAHRYEGFWAPMDTLKDKHNLEALLESGSAPWEIWESVRGRRRTAPI